MFTLIIDTSTERGIVAFAQGEDLAYTKELPFGLLNSHHLMTEIQAGFQSLEMTPHALKAVATSIGPGSFTGLRVGGGTAKGIALGLALPLIGFSSLSGFISLQQGRFLSLIDARVGGAYTLIQERQGNTLTEHSTPEFSSWETLPSLPYVGPSFSRSPLKEGVERYPDAAHIASLVEAKYKAGEFSKEGYLPLLYLRGPL